MAGDGTHTKPTISHIEALVNAHVFFVGLYKLYFVWDPGVL